MATDTLTAVQQEYEIVIGLEVHTQLLTDSKMFCSCNTHYANDEANTHICPVCMGMPGVLPVINKQAVDYTFMVGLALNCSIPELAKFDRKNYFYPDLPKGYQISQYDMPFCVNGSLEITLNGAVKKIGVTRAHLEEDTGRLVHSANNWGEGYSLVDWNRAGIPLLEIVSEPDMRSPEEARLYMQKLRSILVNLGVSSGKMEEGSLRCDANISLRKHGETKLGVKTEIKNMNSFRAVQRALEYEAQRQMEALSKGEVIVQETRGWVETRGVTVSQRVKEYADDYRYFPEPDLPQIEVARKWVEEIRSQMPELPDARRERFIREYALNLADAELLAGDRAMARYFEETTAALTDGELASRARLAANWVMGDLSRLLNASETEISACPITAQNLAALIDAVTLGKVTGKQAKDILERAYQTHEAPNAIIQREGIASIGDTAAIDGFVQEAIAANPKAVADYQKGKGNAVQFLIGQVMRLSKGSAKPDVVQPILIAALDRLAK